MLSLFPSLFDYSAAAIGVLRAVVAMIFIMEGYKTLPKKGAATTFYKKLPPIIELAGGVFFFAGLFTQVAALVLAAGSIKKMYGEWKKGADKEKRIFFYFLLFIISVSFLFLGPGLWGIDYPL